MAMLTTEKRLVKRCRDRSCVLMSKDVDMYGKVFPTERNVEAAIVRPKLYADTFRYANLMDMFATEERLMPKCRGLYCMLIP